MFQRSRRKPWCRPRSARGLAVHLSMLGTAWFLARTVGAEQALPAIEWNAPPGCPSKAQIISDIDATIDRSVLSAGGSRLRARATVIQEIDRYRLEMQIASSATAESKVMEAESCATLASAFAFIVAFTLDPSAAVQKKAPAVLASTSPAPLPAPAEPDEAGHPASTWFRSFGIGPVVATGAGFLPIPALGIGARAGLGASPRWELGGAYWLPRSSRVGVGDAGGNVDLAVATISGCFPLNGASLLACAGAELGRMHARGASIPVQSAGTSLWLAPTVGLATKLSVGQNLAFDLRFDVGVPVFRPRFVLQNLGGNPEVEVYRPAPVFVVLSVEPEFRFSSTDRAVGEHSPK
jgi:hypothetical protein